MATVVFIHGLSNKPRQDFLLDLYKRKLAFDDGFSLDDRGVDASLAYWADVLYPSPDADLASYESKAGDLLQEAADAPPPSQLGAEADTAAERLFVERMAETLDVGTEDLPPETLTPEEKVAIRLERIPLPAGIRNRLMAKFVRDAHLYFFNKEFSPRSGETFRVRDALRERFMEKLRAVGAEKGPLVVVSHSMGTIIAYDCLMHEDDCPAIHGLMTLGSPLGLDEVQDFFPKRTTDHGFPSVKLQGPWINIYDPLDAVAAAAPKLANDFRRNGEAIIEDIAEPNWGTWRHSISKYLQGPILRRKLASMVQVQSI